MELLAEYLSAHGSEDFNDIDHADNNLANGFIGFNFYLKVLHNSKISYNFAI